MHAIAQALLMRSPTVPDPYFSSVTLLQHFNNSIIDSSLGGAVVTQTGGAVITDSAALNGTMYQWYRDSVSAVSNYTEATEAAGFITSGTWTVELIVTFTELPRNSQHNTILHLGNYTTNTLIYANSSGIGGVIGLGPLPAIGERVHLAVVQTATVRYGYANGALLNSVVTPTPVVAHTVARVGAQQPIGAGWPDYTCGARVEEVRITDGIARYPEARTPGSSYVLQTAPFPNY